MNKNQKADIIHSLEKLIGSVRHGHIEWVAFSAKYNDGSTIAIHTEKAPKRPRGIS